MLKDSELKYQIELNHQVLEVVLLSETKILYFLEEEEEAFLYDIEKQFCQKVFIKYDNQSRFIMNMEMTKIAMYHNQKRKLLFYDIFSKVSQQFNQTFRLVGCLNNQIIGIQKFKGLKISFDSVVSEFQLPKNQYKKTYRIKLLGNRLLFINKNKFYLLKINQTQGYEMKGQKRIFLENIDIDIIKTGESVYYIMRHCRGYFVFKNCSRFKIISKRVQPYCKNKQKLLSYTRKSVCMRLDGFINSIYIVSLLKPKYTVIDFDNDMTIANALKNCKFVATKSQILIWNENQIFFFDI